MRKSTIRRALVTAVTGVALLAVAACGAKDKGDGMDGMSGMDHGSGSGSSSSSTAAFNDADVMFAQMMIPHHKQALEMAALAETRAADPEIKSLAAAIKGAQDPEIATLTGWLTTWGKPVEAPMSHGMTGMLTEEDMKNLAAADGKEFDKAFATLMIAHHEGAVEMAKQEVASGQNAEAIALATAISTAQDGEIAQMKAILARL